MKLIASLKQIRKMTRNLSVVTEAIYKSKKLELSEDNSKARRVEALPSNLTRPRVISTVLAIRVKPDEAEIDHLSAKFKHFGPIQQMRVVKPDKKIPSYLHVRF
jgi:hypothetical protein